MTGEQWVTVVIALIGAAAGIGSLVRQIRLDRPDIAGRYEQMAERQAVKIATMQARIEELEREVNRLRQDVRERDRLLEAWQAGVHLLVTQIMSHGEKPLWTPEDISRRQDV